MSQSGGQSGTKFPSVKFPSKLGTHLSTHLRDEKLSPPCPTRGVLVLSVPGRFKKGISLGIISATCKAFQAYSIEFRSEEQAGHFIRSVFSFSSVSDTSEIL
ncbi:hypothetical protein TNCV_582461 [Trichonephila clavipes]|nr:hypothetical protein TNCV_582461 [Trichonephila clavipes]